MKSTLFSLALITFLLPSLSIQAQAPASPIVKQIEVQYAGPSTVSKERILANMRTAVGKPYSEQAVEEDIRNIYATGNITNVRIFGEPIRDGVKVMVVVQTKATVGEVLINGVTQLKVAKLRKDLSTKPGGALNEAGVEQDRQKILEAYADKGFTEAKVTYKVEMNEAIGKARVVFSVNEGGKTSIQTIAFEGNTVFKDKELRKVMKTRSKNLLSYFTKAGRLQNDQLDQDLTALREFYQNHGYVNVQIREPRMETTPNGNVALTIPIIEGAQYHVGKVSVQGAQVFSKDEVMKTLSMTEGSVLSPKGIRNDAKQIQDLYGQRGYVDLQVSPETVAGGKDIVNVTYKLDEGSQSYVERVNIQGNTRTKDKVIRREMAVTPGEVYDTMKVEASKKRLENLNYFSKVDAYPSDTIVPGRKDLNVIVDEKRTGSFNFGAGFSSIDSLIGFAEVQQSNFDLMHPWSFTGGGQRFRTRIQYGTERQDFTMSLVEPWFMDYQVAVGGDLFYNEASYVSDVYAQKDFGFDINARKSIGTFTSVRFEYRLENITIFDIPDDASEQIWSQAGGHTRSAITTGITYDTRDSVFLTRHGQRVDFSILAAGGPLGGTVDVYGLNLNGSQYFSLPWDTIFLINGEIATVSKWAGGGEVPIFDRLYLGGANNLRGFNYRKVGPKDDQDEPIGGNTLARVTLEYTFPVVERVRGALFYDTGFVNGGTYSFGTSDLAADVGIGVRLDLPIGPVRLDYGIPTQSDGKSGSGGKFNFNIGYQF